MQYVQALNNSVIVKDIMLKGVDVYMTRIQVMKDMAPNSTKGNHLSSAFVSPKGPSFHGHANQTHSNLFNTSLHLGKQDSNSRRSGLFNGGDRKDKSNLFYQHK